MRVRMLTDMTGARGGVPWPPYGHEMDVGDEEAHHLAAIGVAAIVEDGKPPQAAPIAVQPAPAERAVAPDEGVYTAAAPAGEPIVRPGRFEPGAVEPAAPEPPTPPTPAGRKGRGSRPTGRG